MTHSIWDSGVLGPLRHLGDSGSTPDPTYHHHPTKDGVSRPASLSILHVLITGSRYGSRFGVCVCVCVRACVRVCVCVRQPGGMEHGTPNACEFARPVYPALSHSFIAQTLQITTRHQRLHACGLLICVDGREGHCQTDTWFVPLRTAQGVVPVPDTLTQATDL